MWSVGVVWLGGLWGRMDRAVGTEKKTKFSGVCFSSNRSRKLFLKRQVFKSFLSEKGFRSILGKIKGKKT